LLLDTFSRHVRASRARRGAYAYPLSGVERGENARRQRALWWYFLRGPMWESLTKPRLERMATRLQDKPLLGFASMLLRDYVPLIDEYYFFPPN